MELTGSFKPRRERDIDRRNVVNQRLWRARLHIITVNPWAIGSPAVDFAAACGREWRTETEINDWLALLERRCTPEKE